MVLHMILFLLVLRLIIIETVVDTDKMLAIFIFLFKRFLYWNNDFFFRHFSGLMVFIITVGWRGFKYFFIDLPRFLS